MLLTCTHAHAQHMHYACCMHALMSVHALLFVPTTSHYYTPICSRWQGGGLSVWGGKATLINSKVYQNEAHGGGQGVTGRGQGGGLFVNAGGEVDLDADCNVYANQALSVSLPSAHSSPFFKHPNVSSAALV